MHGIQLHNNSRIILAHHLFVMKTFTSTIINYAKSGPDFRHNHQQQPSSFQLSHEWAEQLEGDCKMSGGLKFFYDALSQPSRAVLILLELGHIPYQPCLINIAKGKKLHAQVQCE